MATKARTLAERTADLEARLADLKAKATLVGRAGRWTVKGDLQVPVEVVAVGPKVHGQQLVVVRFAGSNGKVGDGTVQVALRKVELD